jgi:hypothetical protein
VAAHILRQADEPTVIPGRECHATGQPDIDTTISAPVHQLNY